VQNGRDAVRTGAAKRVNDDEQLHQIMVRRWRGRLDDENIFAAHIFLDADKRFAVRKRCDGALSQFDVDGFANGAFAAVANGPDAFKRKNGPRGPLSRISLT